MMLYFTIVLLWWGAGLVGHLIGFVGQYFDEGELQLDVEEVVACLFSALIAGPIFLVAAFCHLIYCFFSNFNLIRWISENKFKVVINLKRKK